MKEDVGVLSDDLFADLFPSVSNESMGQNRIHYVAVTPWLPSSVAAPQTANWTILPVRAAEKADASTNRPHSSLHFPAASLALQSFMQTLHSLSPNKTQRRDTPIEIRILDVLPLGLDTIFVTLDTDALRKLDEVHAKFGGGFGISRPNPGVKGPRERFLEVNGVGGNAKTTVDTTAQEQAWKKAVRDALKAPTIVHTGDLLPLPIPSHPITHAPPPPAKITACEPVSQGLLFPSTKIVMLRSHALSKSPKTMPPVSTPTLHNGIGEDDDDTSNEQFYSAAEERTPSQGATPPDEDVGHSTADNLDSELSGTDGGDLSDDSEDMISLSTPMLPPQSSGVLSFSATPRPGAFQMNGIATPGSVFSSFTATTARGPISKGKLFKAQGLLESIPDELIHPKPGSEDDEEARVFVDTNTLVKVGCFSGDWVKLEAAAEPQNHGLGAWGLAAFGDENEESPEWRAAKIYGLPEMFSRKVHRYPVNKQGDRRSSISGMIQPTTTSQAYLSPVLLANLGGPTHLRIATLAPHQPSHLPRGSIQKPRITGSSLPPSAKEVTLLKLSTPLSTDRLLQASLFAALKEHFEQKRRIVKSGDLVGIAIDESLGKALFHGPNADEDVGSDELLSQTKYSGWQESSERKEWNAKAIAWFKVGNVVATQTAGPRENEEINLWGGIVSVDASSTKMVQAGSEQGKVPATMSSSWQYYLGAKRPPAASGFALSKALGINELPKLYISSLRRRLRELISAATSPRAINLGLPPLAILITSTQRGIGKSTIAARACEDLGLHTFSIDAFDILTEGGAGGGDVKTEAFLKARAERAFTCGAEYTALLIRHVEALNADRMTTALKEILADSRVLIATTTEIDKVPEGIRGLFTHELEMPAPDEAEREGILRGIVEDSGIRLSPDVELSNIAVKTAALVAGDLVDVVNRAIVAKQTRLESLAQTATKPLPTEDKVTIRDIELAGGPSSNGLTKSDLDTAVEAARKNFADAIGAPKIPNVSWSDVGGLTHVKDAVMETIQLPLARPELFAKGMKKRSGILFYGPPGTGKTLLAKAIATEFSLNFFSVKGPELLNMYIGESEANVRRVFQRARDARPCVVFFDELDSVAPKRGNQGDSGGVMDRIVSQLLAELDGMSDGGEGVFVIGATNRPDLLDQALLRPGRFDKMLYLGVSDTHEKQLTILEALTRKFNLDPSLSLQRIASSLPFTYTGADLYALCSDAMLKAITRQARSVDRKVKAYNAAQLSSSAGSPTGHTGRVGPISVAYFFDHLATGADTAVLVTEQDFLDANKELVPSVSVDELGHYERVRKTFEGSGKQEEHKAVDTGAVAIRQHSTSTAGYGSGKGKGKGIVKVGSPSPHDFGQMGDPIEREDSDDDYIIRTDHLKVNGTAGGGGGGAEPGKGKGKVKGKGKGKSSLDIAEGGFGDAAQDDEELYA